MSPLVFLTISNKTTFLFIIFESLYLSTDLSTSHHLRYRVSDLNPFPKVLNVSPKCMVKMEELTMLVEQRKLATPLQPTEPHSCLAYWAWELPVNTPHIEYAIHQEVMQGVVVPPCIMKFFFVARSYVSTPFSQARIDSSMRGSMNTPILFPGCLGIINDKNTFLS